MTTPTIPFPSSPAWQPFTDAPLGDAAFAVLKQNLHDILTRQKAQLGAITITTVPLHEHWQHVPHELYLAISEADLHGVLAALNGVGTLAPRETLVAKGLTEVIELDIRNRLLPHLSVKQLFRWLQTLGRPSHFWVDYRFQYWLTLQPLGTVDLRALAAALQTCGVAHGALFVANAGLAKAWDNHAVSDRLPAHCVWPFFAEHPYFIDAALGIAVNASAQTEGFDLRAFKLEAALKVLAIFPVLQPQWLTAILEIALGEGKTYRALAIAALAPEKNLGEVLLPFLRASKIDNRIEAANLLANMQHRAAIPALVSALKTESRESARAAFLSTLESLGEDISPYLAPEILLAEALKGLKNKLPSGLEWFKSSMLPACVWRDGSTVAPEILRWWVVFTCKLKEPGGNALVTRYLHLLAPDSWAAFSRVVLLQFIAEDSRQLPLVPGMSAYDKWVAAREYITSAIGEKGILALTACTPPQELVAQIMQFMRDHHLHRAQIEALLEAAASSNEPLVIQMLIGVARRHRTASVQLKAQALIAQIAEKNGWTPAQLADRTTPTAGLDDTGKVLLQYGARTFNLVLDAGMKFVLQNNEGHVIKALPEPRADDDAELIKIATAQFATSKKELKMVLDSQAPRLQEAMCVERRWPAAQWREYLHGHPIVGRLIQRLLWIQYDADGLKRSVFRPSEDGSLVGLDDNEVVLAADSTVGLAHSCLLESAQTTGWLAHFKDYKIAPLFAQLTRNAPTLALQDADITAIASHQGWMSDTFPLRSAFTKLGYQRAATEDGGFFDCYVKAYSAVGIKVRIEFSGNTLPEENIPAALKTLSFETENAKSWNERFMPPQNVPPLLLAEAHADYLSIAQRGSGFASDWETKVRF